MGEFSDREVRLVRRVRDPRTSGAHRRRASAVCTTGATAADLAARAPLSPATGPVAPTTSRRTWLGLCPLRTTLCDGPELPRHGGRPGAHAHRLRVHLRRGAIAGSRRCNRLRARPVIHRGAAPQVPSTAPATRVGAWFRPPRLGGRRALQRALPPAPYRAPTARGRPAAETTGRPSPFPRVRSRQATVGVLVRRQRRRKPIRRDLEDAPLHGRRDLGRHHRQPARRARPRLRARAPPGVGPAAGAEQYPARRRRTAAPDHRTAPAAAKPNDRGRVRAGPGHRPGRRSADCSGTWSTAHHRRPSTSRSAPTGVSTGRGCPSTTCAGSASARVAP